ncbi:hypothetical protein ACGFY3_48470 [Streptomyces mirabilis]|uniref:hypothetical protein n=1 Tax=Streptomyces mirabilis TaxID=68239 RepID=UPI0037113E55
MGDDGLGRQDHGRHGEVAPKQSNLPAGRDRLGQQFRRDPGLSRSSSHQTRLANVAASQSILELTVGSLTQVLAGRLWAQVAASIPRRHQKGCTPDEDSCMPSPRKATACNPDQDGSDCSPAETPACEPSY